MYILKFKNINSIYFAGTELFLNEISNLWNKILLSNPQARSNVCTYVMYW